MSEHPMKAPSEMEPDAKLVRILGLVLFIVLPIACFYIGTVTGKEWRRDYQPNDMINGFRVAGYGFGIAAAINVFIYGWYMRVVKRDSIAEWYEPQSHHQDHSGGHH